MRTLSLAGAIFLAAISGCDGDDGRPDGPTTVTQFDVPPEIPDCYDVPEIRACADEKFSEWCNAYDPGSLGECRCREDYINRCSHDLDYQDECAYTRLDC